VAQRLLVPIRARKPVVYSGFRLGERGAEPVGSPTREQWSDCLDYLMHMGRRIHFWIGDLLVYGERRWGEMYDEMIERTGYEARTLRTLKWVAGQIEAARRRDDLTFAHHQEVAGLVPEYQDALLAEAAREGWTREMVRHAVNRLSYEHDRPAVTASPGLRHGDWREVMPTLPDESVDLLLTAPPDIAVLDAALTLATAKLKPNSHVYVFGTWQAYPDIADVVEQHFDLRNTLAWVKDTGANAGGWDNYGDQYEVILFAHKGRRHLNGPREGDVLHFDAIASPQPGEKPLALLRYLIGKSTKAGETVLDPFANVGNTCVAAKLTERGFVGIEGDRGLYEHAVSRLAQTW
jgi:DNA methylase